MIIPTVDVKSNAMQKANRSSYDSIRGGVVGSPDPNEISVGRNAGCLDDVAGVSGANIVDVVSTGHERLQRIIVSSCLERIERRIIVRDNWPL